MLIYNNNNNFINRRLLVMPEMEYWSTLRSLFLGSTVLLTLFKLSSTLTVGLHGIETSPITEGKGLSTLQQVIRCYQSGDTLSQVPLFIHYWYFRYFFGDHCCSQNSLLWIRNSGTPQSNVLLCKSVLQSWLSY